MALCIRLATGHDADQIAAIYAPVVRNTAISFELEPPPIQEMEQRIQQTLPRFPWLVCEQANMILGYVYASPHRARPAYQWSVDTTVYVHHAYRGHGVGRRARRHCGRDGRPCPQDRRDHRRQPARRTP